MAMLATGLVSYLRNCRYPPRATPNAATLRPGSRRRQAIVANAARIATIREKQMTEPPEPRSARAQGGAGILPKIDFSKGIDLFAPTCSDARHSVAAGLDEVHCEERMIPGHPAIPTCACCSTRRRRCCRRCAPPCSRSTAAALSSAMPT
jgi:hypothetical protein